MKYIKVPENIQKRVQETINDYPNLTGIIEAIHNAGGKVLLVGGAVRDLFLQLPIKDLDIEVHGLSLVALEEILGRFGIVDTVGKAFGVLRIHPFDIDWSVPRVDTAGRKPEVKIDPFMGVKEAFARRDLTMNAMGVDLVTYELIDPFHGLQDMQNNILRAPDPEFFVEDPLRFFRVMQFCARFEMEPDDELNEICAKMDVSGVSRERIETEFAKWLLRSKKPSLALDWLQKIGRLGDILPEVAALQGVVQGKKWHPEGDVYEHTKQTLDAAAALDYTDEREKLILMYAALCHDLGKATSTQIHEGKITSYGHAKEGERLSKKLLKRIMRNKDLITAITKLVRYHMLPLEFIKEDASMSAYKRLARKLAPEVTLRMLAKLSLIDKQGRNPKKGEPLTTTDPDVEAFLQKAEHAHVLEQVEEPVLRGRDLLDVVPLGKQLGELVKKAYEIQIEKGIKDKEELKMLVLSSLPKKS